MTWARCSECGETFGSDSGFDLHRIRATGQPGWDPDYDWRCASPDELRAKGWFQDKRSWWRRSVIGDGAASRRAAVSARHHTPPTAADIALHEQAEGYERHRDFLRWAEMDRKVDPAFDEEEPRPGMHRGWQG